MKLYKSDAPKCFLVEQGIWNPRESSYSFRGFSKHDDLLHAKEEIKGCRDGVFRIVEAREIFTSLKPEARYETQMSRVMRERYGEPK